MVVISLLTQWLHILIGNELIMYESGSTDTRRTLTNGTILNSHVR